MCNKNRGEGLRELLWPIHGEASLYILNTGCGQFHVLGLAFRRKVGRAHFISKSPWKDKRDHHISKISKLGEENMHKH